MDYSSTCPPESCIRNKMVANFRMAFMKAFKETAIIVIIITATTETNNLI